MTNKSFASDTLCTSIMWLMVVLTVTFFIGCNTHSKRISRLRQSFHQGDVETAFAESEQLLEKARKDQVLYQLDQSLIKLAQGNAAESERLLRDVRNQFSNEPPFGELQNLSSMVLDDQSRPFQPDDYEKLFVLTYLAMSNLVQNGDDAYAYANQIMELQSRIDEKARKNLKWANESKNKTPVGKSSEPDQGADQSERTTVASTEQITDQPIQFKQIALAPFIAGLLHEQTHRDYDTAERYYQRTLEYHPSFREAIHGLERTKNGRHSQKGNGVLYVFTAVGKGPFKVEHAEVPTSQAMLIADRILSAVGDHTLPPTLAPIKTARVIVPRNDILNVHVQIGSSSLGETETVSDLGQIAIEQDRATQDLEMARAIARRIIKKSAIYASKRAMETESHSWVDMLINLGGVAWEAAESADTRSWGLLPEKIQVLRVELPVGTHQVSLTPMLNAVNGIQPYRNSYSADVEIHDGFNSYLFANFPTPELIGEILVSRR